MSPLHHLAHAEALLLAHLVLRPHPRRDALLDAHPTLAPHHTQALSPERARALLAPWQRRFAPVHASWVERALLELPQPLHRDARPWLSQGLTSDHVLPSRRWLQARCLARFPLGPNHLDDDPPPPSHPAHLARLPTDDLLTLLRRLGLRGLALTLQDADRRQVAAVLAALPEPDHRHRVLHHLAHPDDDPLELRHRMQEAILRARQHPHPADIPLQLGAHLLAQITAHRFHLEGRFLAARLPQPLGALLLALIPRLARRPHDESERAREHLGGWIFEVRKNSS